MSYAAVISISSLDKAYSFLYKLYKRYHTAGSKQDLLDTKISWLNCYLVLRQSESAKSASEELIESSLLHAVPESGLKLCCESVDGCTATTLQTQLAQYRTHKEPV